VLFGVIELRTAHRTVPIRKHTGQVHAQAFLRELRRAYRCDGWLWLPAS
jgi:hypothetical protein